MKLYKTLTITIAALLIPSFTASAGELKQESKKETAKELKYQTHCPVMGGEIDSTVYTDIQGQRVYHCCPGCSSSLKNDPDKFFKKAAAESVLFENIQTACPVSGENLEDKSVFTNFEGRRIALCCENCIEKFNKDPQKFLTMMDAPVEKMEGKMNHKKAGHEERNH